MEVMLEAHIRLVRLEEFPVKARRGRQRKVYLRVREVDTNALSRALIERHEVFAALCAFGPEPALGPEGPRVGEDGLVGVDTEGGGADGCAGRDCVLMVLEGFVGRDASESAADPEGEAEAF